MSLHSDRRKANDMNFMVEKNLDDAKRYLGYIIEDYRSGKSKSVWCPSRDLMYASKIFNVIEKSLTYLCVDFSLRSYHLSATGYYVMEISFNESI